jgi:hypothetical protein
MNAVVAPRSALGDLAEDPYAGALVDRFLQTVAYDAAFCLDLVALARDRHQYSWALRRLAILMLEHQVRALSPEDEEVGSLLTALGLPDLTAFPDLRARLARLDRVHVGIDGPCTPAEALAAFVEASRRECKLTLGRYLFTPEEVVERIVAALRTSTGVRDRPALEQPHVREEVTRCLEGLPPYEAAIVTGLCARATVYWVSPSTSSRINSLVEYPHETVVVVIKPPGSDLEIEIKRVGMRSAEPWHAVFERDGDEVPSTHRIQGASMAYYLRWEAASAAGLAHVHRLVHGREAPVSRTVAVSTVYGVPANGSECHVVSYFTTLAGPGGREDTRRAMRASIDAFCREMRSQSLPARNDLQLAAQFLGQAAPAQSVLAGTSSFRLDRLAGYLSPDGADRYFALLGEAPGSAEARAFADDVLEEALGVLTPRTAFETHAQYVDAAFADPENRARADRNYVAAMRQIGAFWGTLAGMRSYTYGESFVARNVGLKSVWQHGEWTPGLVFLDHDGTYLSGMRSREFHPLSAIPGMRGDHMHVWGFREVKGSTEWLRILFRIDEAREREAQAELRREMRRTFDAARRAIREDPQVQRCFHSEFVDRFADWDDLVVEYLGLDGDPDVRNGWYAAASRRLEEKRYPENLAREYLSALDRYSMFLERYGFLYGLDYEPPPSIASAVARASAVAMPDAADLVSGHDTVPCPAR